MTNGEDMTSMGVSDGGVGPVRAGLNRRTVLAGAAWTVPAIAMVTASPAFAASSALLNVSTPLNQIPASGATTVTANLKTSAGAAVSGALVTFTGPSGASVSPASSTTNSSGNATTSVDLATPWAKPGSMVTVNASSNGETKSQPLTILGSNLVAAGMGYMSTPAQTELVFPSPVVQATAGALGGSSMNSGTFGAFAVVLLQDGTVWARGDNDFGQLGDNTTTSRATWAKVSGITTATQIAAGRYSAYALLTDGTMRAWGQGDDGRLGNGNTFDAKTPVKVSNLTGVTHIAAGANSAYAIANGGAWAWGANPRGQLGNGTTNSYSVPQQVTGLTSGVTSISGGLTSAYAVVNGSAKGWGFNYDGEVGDGTTTTRTTPQQVTGLTSGVTQVAGGFTCAYALVNGAVMAWGRNTSGTLGNATAAASSPTPIQVPGLTSGVTEVVAGWFWAAALRSDGSVVTWGSNTEGQRGAGGSGVTTWAVPTGREVERLGVNSSVSFTAFVVTKTS